MKIAANHLEVLVAVAEGKGFRKAAATLGISQASVTNNLRVLQKELVTPLFVTEGKKKVLTPFGKAVSEMANRNLARLESDLLDVKQLHANGTAAPLRVGCRPEIFAHVADHLPHEARYHFVPLSGGEVGTALLNGKIDVGFGPLLPDSHQVVAKKAFVSSADFVIHKNLLGKRRDSAPWKNKALLKEIPALAYGTDGHLLADLCEKLGLTLDEINIKIVADAWTTLAQLTTKEMGYAVVPAYVDCGPEVARYPLPSHVLPTQQFHCLVRAAYREVPLFKKILNTNWVHRAR